MAYVYRHIRLDKNEPFYIGIGKKDNGKFSRSRMTYGRNPIWKKIVLKTRYEVEIIMTDLSLEDAMAKEREFISLYGRMCNNTGILANISIGGDGVLGLHGALNGMFGRPDKKRRSILQFDLKGRFVVRYHSITQASKEMGWPKMAIAKAVRRLQRTETYKGYIWEYADSVSDEWVKQWISKKVVQPFENKMLPMEAYIVDKLNLNKKRIQQLERKRQLLLNQQ